jgi:hypothetical protein
MVVAILTGHAPVRKHLHTMGLFEGGPTCRFCRQEAETVQHITCCCEALACRRYNVFGSLVVEPIDIRTATVKDLCLFIRGTGLWNLGWIWYSGQHNKPQRLQCIPGRLRWRALIIRIRILQISSPKPIWYSETVRDHVDQQRTVV